MGSTSTSTSGFSGERAGQHEPLPLPAGERPAALLDVGGQTAVEQVEHVLGRGGGDGRHDLLVGGVAARVELVAERPAEQRRVGVADDDRAPYERPVQMRERHAVEQNRSLGEASEPVGERRRVVRTLRHDGGEQAGADDQTGLDVDQVGRRRRRAGTLDVDDLRLAPRARGRSAARRPARGSPCWRPRSPYAAAA